MTSPKSHNKNPILLFFTPEVSASLEINKMDLVRVCAAPHLVVSLMPFMQSKIVFVVVTRSRDSFLRKAKHSADNFCRYPRGGWISLFLGELPSSIFR